MCLVRWFTVHGGEVAPSGNRDRLLAVAGGPAVSQRPRRKVTDSLDMKRPGAEAYVWSYCVDIKYENY